MPRTHRHLREERRLSETVEETIRMIIKKKQALRGEICNAFPNWDGIPSALRAKSVIDWFANANEPCPLSATELQVAMMRMPSDAQGPNNYLDFVRATEAVHTVKCAPAFPLLMITLAEDFEEQARESEPDVETPSP